MNYIIIPARKGSKRIPNKNLLKIKNKTLLELSIEHGKNSKKVNKIFVSSNDNINVKKVCDKQDVNFIKRPEKISSDSSSTELTISHFIDYLKKNNIKLPLNIILLQCTSPMRNIQDIDEAISKFQKGKYDSLFSGYISKDLIWIKNKSYIKPINYSPKKRRREQKMKLQITENGSIYIFKTTGFIKNKCRLFGNIGFYKMTKKNSIQIDNLEDLEILKKL